MLRRNLRRTIHKPVAGRHTPLGICPRRANAWRGRSRRTVPTNEPAVAVQSSMPAAVLPPPHLSYPRSTASRPADDTVQLQKTSRLLFLLFELPGPTNQG